MRNICLAGLCLLSVVGTPGFAADPGDEKKAYTDPSNAPESFRIQGEYAGSWNEDSERRSVGIQVIALGGDKYEAVAYPGGLPGAGWNGEERIRAEGEMKDGVARFVADEGRGRVENGQFIIEHTEGEMLAALPKVERKSPTLGKKAPQGAVVLFDGKSADKFVDGKVTDEDYLDVGTRSKDEFGSHTLHIEFRTPFMPNARGQARGNSGVYIQGRYECQVLDSFGLKGEDNECGGIYKASAPKVNMCLPPLSWQTYDIDFTAAQFENGEKVKNARVTIRHNGVVIHDDLELPSGTPGGTQNEGPGPGPLFLQNHGDPVVFRNIWVVPKK